MTSPPLCTFLLANASKSLPIADRQTPAKGGSLQRGGGVKKWFWVFAWALILTGFALYAEDSTSLSGSSATEESVEAKTIEPYVWPVANIIAGHHVKIVSTFGPRKVPMIPGLDTSTVVVPAEEQHEGVDFAVPDGTNVRAAHSGTVLFAGFSSAYVSRKDKKDKNHLVIIRHADGRSTRYVHLDRLMVRPGQQVKSGELLGTSSESDEWTTPVVHFEIREINGKAMDPLVFIPSNETASKK
jgi:murein DD-endopeptidase MepM/ murein hydrolase activator NlpD